jgi:hypothetical protein
MPGVRSVRKSENEPSNRSGWMKNGRDAKESEVGNSIGFAYPSIEGIREKTDMPVISFVFNRAGLTGAFRHGWLRFPIRKGTN